MSADVILKTEGISHTYSAGTPFERAAIRGVSFEARRGEYVGVIGHTGSGKSTFIQHLNGLLKPDEGRVLLGGVDINSSKEERRRARFRVGLVFQFPEYQLFEETTYKDVAFGPRNMGLSPEETDARVREAARFVGLPEDMLEKSPFELSGGFRRRAAVAGVIAMRPEVLILDEPTAGLDPRGRDSLLENIDAYNTELGATVIIVTHSMEEAARRAKRIAVFEDGELVMNGAPREIFGEGARLRQMGLGLPRAAMIAERLRARGVPLGRDIFTVEAIRDSLIAIKNGGGNNAS
ncbi:MAG: energy-coupling factor transporter ATPase [Oscillospiraceae bacterium]|jgi:energy-coupling factor transport system ATP-binding protein|nr:energy-coupling factor transporter ATPase [Oscillospiraceae bacterium]